MNEGHYHHLIDQRNRVLSTARMSPAARAAAMGKKYEYVDPAEVATAAVTAAPITVMMPCKGKYSRRWRVNIPNPTMSTKGGYRAALVVGDDIPNKARDIIHVCCRIWRVNVDLLLSPLQSRQYARPRQAAMSMMAKQLRLSQKAIGRIFSRDHTTVMHAATHLVPRLLLEDRGFRVRYEYAGRELRKLWAVP